MVNRLVVSLAALVAPAFLPSVSTAGTVYVDVNNPGCPGNGGAGNPLCSIQKGILLAQTGDTVLVAPGTYHEDIDFLGKSIEVKSSAGAALTTIQGSGTTSVVTFDNGEWVETVLDGFSITGGTGTPVPWIVGSEKAGGGIFCRDVGPTIQNNDIHHNSADYGGGVYVEGGAPALLGNEIRNNMVEGGGGICVRLSASPTIDGNTIRDNLCAGSSGGGIMVLSGSDPTITDNQIIHNRGVSGGGIYAESSDVTITDNTLENNLADDGDGGGIALSDVVAQVFDNDIVDNQAVFDGGGIYFWNGEATIVRNNIRQNLAAPWGRGGGVAALFDSTAYLFDNTVSDNGCPNQGAGLFLHGGGSGLLRRNIIRENKNSSGVTVFSGSHLFEDCLVVDNDGDGFEFIGSSVSPYVLRSTVTGNQYGAVFVDLGAQVIVRSSILYGNGSSPSSEVFINSGAAVIGYSDVRGGYTGTGNIDLPPQFENPVAFDYTLGSASPCIDAGDPADLSDGVDLALDPRLLDGLLNGIRRVDMGAYEFSNVRLDATVDPGPPSVTIDVTGTAGQTAFLMASAGSGQFPTKFGPVLLDPFAQFQFVLFGPVPSSATVHPPASSLDVTTWLQVVAVNGGIGNVSNVVTVGGD